VNPLFEIALKDMARVAVTAIDVVLIAKTLLLEAGDQIPETQRCALQAIINKYDKFLVGREWVPANLEKLL
jgi:hypothetical protein